MRLVIDAIPTMAWTVRPDGVVDFVNQSWLEADGEYRWFLIRTSWANVHLSDGTTIGIGLDITGVEGGGRSTTEIARPVTRSRGTGSECPGRGEDQIGA